MHFAKLSPGLVMSHTIERTKCGPLSSQAEGYFKCLSPCNHLSQIYFHLYLHKYSLSLNLIRYFLIRGYEKVSRYKSTCSVVVVSMNSSCNLYWEDFIMSIISIERNLSEIFIWNKVKLMYSQCFRAVWYIW